MRSCSCFSSSIRLTFPCIPHLYLFCSLLSSRTMRTLLMQSRRAACRPAVRKWQLRMTVTWSHTRPRRWWQVNNFTGLLWTFSPSFFDRGMQRDLAICLGMGIDKWRSGGLTSLYVTDVHQGVNMTFVLRQESQCLTNCTVLQYETKWFNMQGRSALVVFILHDCTCGNGHYFSDNK